MARSNGNVGRHDLARVPEPIGGFPAVPTSVNNTARTITPVSVADVYDAQRRHRALARIDRLDIERRTGKIDEASYLIGRTCEKVFETMSRISSGGQFCEGDRLDAATAAEVRALLGIERAVQVNGFLTWIHRHVGRMDTKIIWHVLGDRLSFTVVAAALGRDGTRGARYVHDRFADALATLAEAKAAKGREVRRRLR